MSEAITKGERTRERILATAEALILQQGFSGTAIDQIIEDADITKGGFFYHFRGKSDLARGLVSRYLEQDEVFFQGLIDSSESLVDDPLQRLLLFLKLLARAVADLPGGHPGCLVASFTYESQQFDPAIQEMMAGGILRWRAIFMDRMRPVVERYPMRVEVSLDELADMLTSTLEGGIILSRALGDSNKLVEQLEQYRTYMRLLFGDVG